MAWLLSRNANGIQAFESRSYECFWLFPSMIFSRKGRVSGLQKLNCDVLFGFVDVVTLKYQFLKPLIVRVLVWVPNLEHQKCLFFCNCNKCRDIKSILKYPSVVGLDRLGHLSLSSPNSKIALKVFLILRMFTKVQRPFCKKICCYFSTLCFLQFGALYLALRPIQDQCLHFLKKCLK